MHNAFGKATSQPKIPDGRASTSIGLCTQSVFETRNDPEWNVQHFMLFPGMTTAVIYKSNNNANDYKCADMGLGQIADWSSVSEITQGKRWSQWRIVSSGIQFKCLNTNDMDDGWFEAIRCHRALKTDDWYAVNTVATDTANPGIGGAVAPLGLLNDMIVQSMIQHPSYVTGLIRDIHKFQFELHNVMDDHDFQRCQQLIKYNSNTFFDGGAFYNPGNPAGSFRMQSGIDDAKNIIDNYNDMSLDMVYIRVHSRPHFENSDTFAGTRLHVNVISNLEVVHDINAYESRFETKTNHVGADVIAQHHTLRKSSIFAGKPKNNL
jgi:hypothetical protein